MLPILAWVIDSRLLAAALVGLSVGAALLPVLAAPVVSAGVVPLARDDAKFTTLQPEDAAWGAPLAAMWRLRWLILGGLALTPALMVGLLRLDLSAFSAYHDSVAALGSAAPVDQARLLLPGGGIPFVRLAMRAISAGLTVWALLPLAGTLGVAGMLVLDDVTFGQMAGLVTTAIATLLIAAVWDWLSLTPILAGLLEIVRMGLLGGLAAGIVRLAVAVNRWNARLLWK
jgi:hypothetical protein